MSETTGTHATGAIPDARALALQIAQLRRDLRWTQQRLLPTLGRADYPRVDDVPPLIYNELARDVVARDLSAAGE